MKCENKEKEAVENLLDNVQVKICEKKINEDEKWDDLKAYISNTEFSVSKIYEQYSG